MTETSPHDEHRRAEITTELAAIGFCLPGTLTARRTRCSSPGCRCRSEPPLLHGPYYSWTRKIAGKTVTRTLSPAQAERYEPAQPGAAEAETAFSCGASSAERRSGWLRLVESLVESSPGQEDSPSLGLPQSSGSTVQSASNPIAAAGLGSVATIRHWLPSLPVKRSPAATPGSRSRRRPGRRARRCRARAGSGSRSARETFDYRHLA